MIILPLVIGLLVGFGVGRIKNASKINAVKAEIFAIQSSVVTDVESVIARIKSKL